ncbi:Cof-type HAD-IIB family hydrolase [Paenibacillus senegalensis]|uniref:Cof-type HAD-IIB family hydrolase n=1 Tax=Paenibacillus senegalensis TaxID=1465766 RepID=UPI000287F3AC|nr:Cof-type HAD-IIB family hydrolase [Paenibacillus senegalensis]
MHQIRLIVSDLDGTLLSADHTLHPDVRQAVNQFMAAGGAFTIATGRPSLTVRTVADELGIEIPLILCNGSVIADHHEILHMVPLGLEGLLPAIRDADKEDIAVLLFEEEQISVLRRSATIDKYEHKEKVRCRVANLTDERWKHASLQKVLFIGDMDKIQAVWSAHEPTYSQSYATFQSENDYLEIVPGNQSKGEAMKRLANHMNIDLSQVMAIGNQLNDLDMLLHAGIGVAVNNSHPLLKEKADYVCSQSYGQGVAEAIARFCGGGSLRRSLG